MMKILKKSIGFTIPEMIAIILIMGIIAIIAVTLVGGILEESRKESFRDSVRNSIKSIDYYLLENHISSLPNEGLPAQELTVSHVGQFTGGRIITNANGDFEAERITNRRYCATGPLENVRVARECYMLDETGPDFDITKVITTSTTSSIKIIIPEEAIEEKESSIKEYTYEISNSDLNYRVTYTTEDSFYTFRGLKDDTTYDLKLTVTNTNGLSTTKETSAKTNLIDVPTFTINPTGYATSKVVTVNYPERQVDFVYTYSIDLGNSWTTVETGTTADVTFTSNGNIIARVTDGVNYKTASTYTVSGIDTTAPVATVAVTAKTTNTLTATVTAVENESIITDYEFSIDGGSYVSNGTNNVYTYGGVTSGSHTIEVRVTNAAGLETEASTTGSPNDITAPTYSVSPTGYATSKVVTVTYPARQTGFIYTYSLDAGSTWTTLSTGTTTNVTFTANGTIIARIYDGVNYKTASTYTVSGIDRVNPTCTLKVTSGTVGTNGWYTSNITIGFNTTSDDYSGVASSSVSPISITGEGTTTATGTVTDQAGNVGTCTITVYKDATAPTVIVGGNPSAWTSSATLSITAADTTSKLTSTPYSFDGGGTWVSSNSKVFTGNQNVNIAVRDNAGNVTHQTITLSKVDSGLPSITGLDTSCYSPAIAATDSVSGIAGYGISTVAWSGISWAWTSAGYYNFGVKTPGTYYLYAIDNAGNIAGTSVYFGYSTLRDYVVACKGAGTYVGYSAPNGGGSSWRVLFATSSRVYIVPKGTLGTYKYSVLEDGDRYNNAADSIGYYDTQAHAAITALDTASAKYVNTTYSDQGKSIDLQYIADHANFIAKDGKTNWERTSMPYVDFGGVMDNDTVYWVADHHICRDQYSSPTSACTTPFRLYHVNTNGRVDDLDTPVTRAVRPVIRLLTTVYYTGTGDGSESSPLGIVIR